MLSLSLMSLTLLAGQVVGEPPAPPPEPPPEVAPAPPPPPPQRDAPPPPPPPPSAVAFPGRPTDTSPPTKTPAAELPAVRSKWDAQLYGFVELDSIWDSTQSFNDNAGNAFINRKGSYEGEHARTMFGARNSRIGFKLAAPDYSGVRATAQLEMDFLGSQAKEISESAVFTSPLFRMRHFNLKLETEAVDILAGQYWDLFGWQSAYHPNTVAIQGVPGQVYSRNPQLRLSHKFKGDAVSVDVAVAAVRPTQRDSATPDGQAGLRFNVEKWRGTRTAGATGTSVDPFSVGVSGLVRRFAVKELSGSPATQRTETGWGLSFDTLVPLIPSKAEAKGNALTLTGSFVTGQGIANMYSGLSGLGGGLGQFPAMVGMKTFAANIDSGLVAYDGNNALYAIQWSSALFGLQYYFPGSGNFWISANYSWMHSNNITNFTTAANFSKVFKRSQWGDVNLFWDVTPAARIGLEGSVYDQTDADESDEMNLRGQLSFFYLF